MQVCNLASGSRGNCTVVQSGTSAVIIDNGLSVQDVVLRAQMISLDLTQVRGIVVTHEHTDHIKGVAALSEHLGVPVYMHPDSYAQCPIKLRPARVAACDVCAPFEIGDLSIESFRLPHDAAYHMGFSIADGKRKAVIATDLGHVSDATREKLRGADLVMLESNHDVEMLRRGRYPYPLKRRILGGNGHLSNADCARETSGIVQAGARAILLAHLSQDNNTPEIAFEQTKRALAQIHAVEGRDVTVEVAMQSRPTRRIEL